MDEKIGGNQALRIIKGHTLIWGVQVSPILLNSLII